MEEIKCNRGDRLCSYNEMGECEYWKVGGECEHEKRISDGTTEHR